VFGVIAASRARASPKGTSTKPPPNGPKWSRYCASEENPTMVEVRPWKLPAQQMISAWASGTFFTV
jgi:hypothetical protein